MSLTFGPGPFSPHRAGLFSAGELPATAAYAEPYPRRVRAFLRGLPTLGGVRPGLLELSDTVSECPYKGDGQHWHVQIGDQQMPDAAWSLPHPLPEGLPAADHVSFYQDKVTVTVDGNRLGE
ncbi:MAG TPA: DUF427 domain-containing protein [Dermatophilaceae bacterium]